MTLSQCQSFIVSSQVTSCTLVFTIRAHEYFKHPTLTFRSKELVIIYDQGVAGSHYFLWKNFNIFMAYLTRGEKLAAYSTSLDNFLIPTLMLIGRNKYVLL